MRRRLVVIAVCVVLGVAINIAVAWGIAIRPRPSSSILWSNNVSPDAFDYRAPRRRNNLDHFTSGARGEITITQQRYLLGITLISILDTDEFDAMLPHWSVLHDTDPVHGEIDHYTEFASGWPALACRYRTYSYGWSSQRPSVSNGLLTFPAHWVRDPGTYRGPWDPDARRNKLPCIPIWPGFYINTLVYAFAVWCVFFAPFTLRRFTRSARRRRRGLCRRCGYDLRGNAHVLCPECGLATDFTTDAVH